MAQSVNSKEEKHQPLAPATHHNSKVDPHISVSFPRSCQEIYDLNSSQYNNYWHQWIDRDGPGGPQWFLHGQRTWGKCEQSWDSFFNGIYFFSYSGYKCPNSSTYIYLYLNEITAVGLAAYGFDASSTSEKYSIESTLRLQKGDTVSLLLNGCILEGVDIDCRVRVILMAGYWSKNNLIKFKGD